MWIFRVGDSMENISFERSKKNLPPIRLICIFSYARKTKENERKKTATSKMCFALCNQTKLVKFSVYPEQSLFSNDFGNKYWYHHEHSINLAIAHAQTHIQFAQKLKSANSKVNFRVCIHWPNAVYFNEHISLIHMLQRSKWWILNVITSNEHDFFQIND